MAIFSTTQKIDVSSLETDVHPLTEKMKVIAGSVDDTNGLRFGKYLADHF